LQVLQYSKEKERTMQNGPITVIHMSYVPLVSPAQRWNLLDKQTQRERGLEALDVIHGHGELSAPEIAIETILSDHLSKKKYDAWHADANTDAAQGFGQGEGEQLEEACGVGDNEDFFRPEYVGDLWSRRRRNGWLD
jgi:hypothetical protein